MLQQQEIEEVQPDIDSIRRRLQSRALVVRQEAELDLARLPASDLIQLMAQEQRHRASRQKWLVIGICAYALVSITGLVFWHGMHTLNFVGAFSGILAAAMAFSQTHKGAARALAKYDDLAGVGPLVEALDIPDAEVQLAIRVSLTRMLPQLHATDARLLGVGPRRTLRKHLGVHPQSKNRDKADLLVESALKALEQIGDESFIETVESLAQGRGYGTSLTVRSAAQVCLPALKQRVENERLSHDLLRASAPSHADDGELLLRASESAGATEPEELLRASDGVSNDVS